MKVLKEAALDEGPHGKNWRRENVTIKILPVDGGKRGSSSRGREGDFEVKHDSLGLVT